jgi:surface antigen
MTRVFFPYLGRGGWLGLAMLALAGCGADHSELIRAGGLGSYIDRAPPQPTVTSGAPVGALVDGLVPPALPDSSVDAAVAQALRGRLTPDERGSLARASQAAAAAPTGLPVPWKALDGSGAATAGGTVMPTADPYRSLRGDICRDLRQSVQKKGELQQQQATLCRTDLGSGLEVWLLARGD